MTRRGAAAWMLGLIVFAMVVAWVLRPAAERAAPHAGASGVASDAPVVRPRSAAPAAAPQQNAPGDAEEARHRAKFAALQDYRAWLAERLAAEDTARSLALAVTLVAPGAVDPFSPAGDVDPRVPRWFARARAIAGDDGVAWAMLLSIASSSRRGTSTSVDALAVAWAEHDPDNLAPWLHLTGDAAHPEEWLSRALSPRARVTVHWLDVEAVTLAAYRRYPPPSPWREQLIGANGWDEEGPPLGLAPPISLPPLQRVATVCVPRDARVKPPTACVPLGRTMVERSDTVLLANLGMSILRRADPGGRLPVDLRAQSRLSQWRFDQYTRLGERASLEAMAAYLRETMPLTEAGMILFALEREGVRTTPPAGWNPPDTR